MKLNAYLILIENDIASQLKMKINFINNYKKIFLFK